MNPAFTSMLYRCRGGYSSGGQGYTRSQAKWKHSTSLPGPENLTVEQNPGPSKYLKPMRIRFTQAGKKRAWDLIESHDAVCVVVYHKEKDSIVLVRQFRPAVYYRDTKEGNSEKANLGFTLELPAGLVDKKGKSRQQIAAEEVMEETGFKVDTSSLTLVNKYRSSVGLIGSVHDVYYTEVSDSMQVGDGGGLDEDGERIEVVLLPVKELAKFLGDPDKVVPAGLLYALQWFAMAQPQKRGLGVGVIGQSKL
mmetsp:Transcript_6683/g.10325  ORF Transcript_6683/g.10325 Transcript_6683/m.10325 type:complete len:251 (-) Transcript_6683:45-797(-)